ncbi:MAG: hypothetical protein ACR2MA_09505 [Egibacteraceae bacterium]
MRTRFTQSARKHRIGKARALHVINTITPTVIPAVDTINERRVYVGPDDRGVDLEIVALVEPDYLLVIHVMPANFRRRST